MQESINVTERMRQDWNRRAQEDAHYYVAFGRRDQDDEEFFSTAEEIYKSLETELKRLPANPNPRSRRALEIGCGPGRLMKPMSRHFGEIHGVDVSDEMIAKACRNLRNIPHAHPHATTGSDLAPFADDSFDFVYSYAVFQHIPSRDVVMQYLREAHRVLKPGGILRCQLNGLDETAKTYDTWSGVRIAADEVRNFASSSGMQLLVLEGARTQYMWATLRKPSVGIPPKTSGSTRIRRITNAHTGEPVLPARGRFASFTVWMEDLPQDCDLVGLQASVGGVPVTASYIGLPERDGLQQLNFILQREMRTGMQPLEILWNGQRLCPPSTLRVIPQGPMVPHVWTVSDGVNVMSEDRVMSGSIKVTIEETDHPEQFRARLGDVAVESYDIFCSDPSLPRFEINFDVPRDVAPGKQELRMRIGKRELGTIWMEVLETRSN